MKLKNSGNKYRKYSNKKVKREKTNIEVKNLMSFC